jgi:tetratricopeptide (TPR) repeat protein
MLRRLELRSSRFVAPLRHLFKLDIWFAAVIGGVTFLLAYDQGGFTLSSRATTAIVAWWALLLGLGLGVWPRSNVPRAAWTVAGLLIAFAVWTLCSVGWADSAENAFLEFNRVTLYVAVFLLSMFAGSRANLTRWPDGLAVGISAVAMVSLVSRCFPSTFSLQGFATFLPGLVTRLSFPIGYWNGLAIFVGFGYPLLLGIALRASRWWTRALALAPTPILAAVIYLTSSRGGVAVAAIGAIGFFATTERRWTAFASLVVAAAGSLAALSILLTRHQLVDGPIPSPEAATQGHEAFLLILAISVGTGGVYALGHRLLGAFSPKPLLGWFLLATVALALLAAVLASDPSRRLENFKQRPGATESVQGHLLSGAGSGRWQFWTAAVDEWKSAPILGRGAGSYGAWWAEHASFSYFVRNAHSLYLEVLGELGLVGFLLLGAAFAYGGLVAVRNTLRRSGEERVVAASLLGVVAAFFVAAGLDWIWQLTAIAAVGLISLGLLVGPAASSAELRSVTGRSPTRLPRFVLGATVLALGWAVLCAQALPWVTAIQVRRSAAALDRGDGTTAFRRALEAKNLEPWAASPYLQLALVEEQRRKLRDARKWIQDGIDRNPIDWRLWLVAARIETKAGDINAARGSLRRAEALNPRSPLFTGAGG